MSAKACASVSGGGTREKGMDFSQQKTKNKTKKKKNQVGTRHKNVESTHQSQGKKGVGTKTPSQGGLLIDVPGLWRLKQSLRTQNLLFLYYFHVSLI
jgi:hypothetical protein